MSTTNELCIAARSNDNCGACSYYAVELSVTHGSLLRIIELVVEWSCNYFVTHAELPLAQ